MKRSRMNLFRDLLKEASGGVVVVPENTPRKPIAISAHVAIALSAVIVILLGLGTNYLKFRRQMKDFQTRLNQAEQDLKNSVAEMENLSKRDVATEKRPTAVPAGLDGTWTSLLWKFAAMTPGSNIVITRMELVRTGPATGKGNAVVKLIGHARTLGQLRNWLDLISGSLTNFDFAMERQGKSNDPVFPVEFQLTASQT